MNTTLESPIVCKRLDELLIKGRKFSCIYADPPWSYNQSPRGAAINHYPTMPFDEMKRLPISQLAMDDCQLHLWTTHSFYSTAIELMSAWGFEYRSVFVWVKPQLGMGHYWRSSSEFLLLGVRGKTVFGDRSIPNWACVPRAKHSVKPEIFRKLIELVSAGPRLELFGRKAVTGWTVFGNQVQQISEAKLFANDTDHKGA